MVLGRGDAAVEISVRLCILFISEGGKTDDQRLLESDIYFMIVTVTM